MKVNINDSERAEMLSFYEGELRKTVSRLQHLKNVLSQLDSETRVEVVVVGMGETAVAKPKATRVVSKPGKRGRKSKWGKFILESLKQNQRPLKYSEIIGAAKIRFNISDEDLKPLKAAINQAAFRLRTKHGAVDTHGEDGRKEKYIGLNSWFDKGVLKPEFKSLLN